MMRFPTAETTSDQTTRPRATVTASPRRPLRARAGAVGLALGWLVILLVMTLSGCAGGGGKVPEVKMPEIKIPESEPPPQPTRLILDISASPGLNPNPIGNPAPLVVRIYELAETGRFTGSGFHSLYEDDRSVLGDDMVGRDELRMRPGGRETMEKTLGSDTSAIGVVAAYRNLDGVRWRSTAPIVPETDNRLTLTLGAREIALAPSK